MKTIRFELPVTYQIPFTNQTDTFMDAGILMLPDSYSESGEPTRLVVNCHGAGGTVSTDDSQVEHQVLSMYLLANGYAILDREPLLVITVTHTGGERCVCLVAGDADFICMATKILRQFHIIISGKHLFDIVIAGNQAQIETVKTGFFNHTDSAIQSKISLKTTGRSRYYHK